MCDMTHSHMTRLMCVCVCVSVPVCLCVCVVRVPDTHGKTGSRAVAKAHRFARAGLLKCEGSV